MNMISLAAARARRAAARARIERYPEGSSVTGPLYRARLANWLEHNAARSHIVIVQAPAAYGKSEVLNLWAAQLRKSGERILRIACTSSDTDARYFELRLSRTLESAGISLPAGEIEGDCESPEDLHRRRSINLIVDEEAVRLAGESLSRLFELALATAGMRLIVASRRRITQGLARARAQGHVALLESAEISLDPSEARGVLEAVGVSIDDPSLDVVMAQTGGWPPAVRMLAVPASEPAVTAKAAEMLAGRSVIADFFVEEVMSQLCADLAEFLQSVAILDRLHPSLCDAITGAQHAHVCLERLSGEGLFVLRIDDGAGWYQLHPLFGAFLRGSACNVSAEDRRRQHLMASQWFDREGMFVEAFDHAMFAGDPECAARVFHAHAGDFYMSGLETAIVPTASRLPASVRERFPRIMLAMSWRLMAEFRFGLASALLEAADARIREICSQETVQSLEGTELVQDVTHCRIMQFMFREDFAALDREAGALMRVIEHRRNPYMVMSLYAAMMYSQGEQFRLGSHERLEALAREHLSAVPSRYVHVLFESMAASGRLLRGETQAVVVLLRNALETAVDISGRASAFPATVALTLAEALYVQNEVSDAAELLEQYLPRATDGGYVDQLISGYLTKARIQRLHGNDEAALETLQAAEVIAEERGFERLRSMAGSERIALLCQLDRTDEAGRVAYWHGLKPAVPPQGPTRHSTRAESALAMAWVRLAQANGNLVEAQAVARSWRNHACAGKAVTAMVDWDILRVQLLLAGKEDTAARRLIVQALTLSAPTRRIRAFVDEAGRLMRVFEALASVPLGDGVFGRFASTVISVIENERGVTLKRATVETDGVDAAAMGDLTARELGILKLAAAGHMNGEIGKRLGLTAGTVKWYLHQVYRKFGCQRRIQAIEQGRRLGLIT